MSSTRLVRRLALLLVSNDVPLANRVRRDGTTAEPLSFMLSSLKEKKNRTFFRNDNVTRAKPRSDREETMATFRILAPTTRTALLADLEGLWERFDELLAGLGPSDWSGKHGQHWTFTDVPYHLAYFDLDVIATAIRRGLNVPLREQVLRSEAEQDAWNEIKFTQRPADTTPQQCLEQMWSSRQAIRDAIAGLSEADLERPVFIPLVGLGWVSIRVALESCYSHT